MSGSADDSLDDWQRRRHALVSVLVRLGELAASREDVVAASTIRGATRRLQEGRLTLAILGEFKRGKSTLINSLLDAEVMPVGVIPMTSIPLWLEHGEQPGAVVEFEDGGRHEVALENLADYATETGNPHNRRGVVAVQVQYPAPILKSGVILVDTPGIGSIHAHNTKAAYDQLAKADAAVFVLSIDSPASQAELDFLTSARDQVSRIIFVLNKVDLLTPEELARSMSFVRSVLQEAGGGEDILLLPISARRRDDGFRRFMAALERFLVQDRGRFLLERARTVARRGVQHERQAIEVERAALRLTADELDRRVKQLAERLTDVARRRVEAEEILAGDFRRLTAATLDTAIGRFRQGGENRVAAVVEEELSKGRVDLRGRLGRGLAAVVQQTVETWIVELEGELDLALKEVAIRHRSRANQLIADAVKQVAEIFQVDLAQMTMPTDLEPRSQRLVMTDDQQLALGMVSSALKGLAPGRLGIAVARRDALRRGEDLIDRHCGRLRHDVMERLAARENAWLAEMREAIAGVEEAVTRAAAIAARAQSDGEPAVLARLAQLDEQAANLLSLERFSVSG